MRLVVQARDRNHRLNKSTLQAVEKLFGKLERYLPNPSMVEVRLEHVHSRKKGRTHYVHATATIPGEPTTLHVEALTEDFRTAADRVYDKIEKMLRRRQARLVRQARSRSRKAQGLVGKFLGRFRRG